MDHLPQRIVSLQPSATAILAGLGQLHRLVACTRYCADICPEVAATRLILHDSWTAHSSQIIAAHPDLVIAAVPYQEKALAEILKSGARFLGLAPRTLSDIYTDIATIAGVVGAAPRALHLIGDMQAQIEAVRARTSHAPRPAVFCEEWGKPLIASQPWVAELIEAAGGRPLAEPGKPLEPDMIRSLDPDILIAAWCGAGDRVPLEKIVEARHWTHLRAVQQARVYCIRDEFLNTPAPTLLHGLQALAAAIHPQLFPAAGGLRQISELKNALSAHTLPR